MARIRTVKPSFWDDDKVMALGRDARLLLLGLITQADDEGRLVAAPTRLLGALYAGDADVTPAKVRQWRDQLESTGIVVVYRVKGVEYVWLRNWSRHQRINRPSPSVLPAPPSLNGSPPPHGGLTEDSLNAHGRPDESLTTSSVGEGKGDRKGREVLHGETQDPPSQNATRARSGGGWHAQVIDARRSAGADVGPSWSLQTCASVALRAADEHAVTTDVAWAALVELAREPETQHPGRLTHQLQRVLEQAVRPPLRLVSGRPAWCGSCKSDGLRVVEVDGDIKPCPTCGRRTA